MYVFVFTSCGLPKEEGLASKTVTEVRSMAVEVEDTEEVESTVARLGCEDLISVRARRFMSYELRQCWGDWSVIGVDPLSLFLLGGHVLHFFKSETGGLEWAQDEGLHVLEEEAVVRSGEFFDLQDESLVQGFGRGEGVSGRLGHVELLLAYPARLLLMAASSSASADLVLHERTILDAVRMEDTVEKSLLAHGVHFMLPREKWKWVVSGSETWAEVAERADHNGEAPIIDAPAKTPDHGNFYVNAVLHS